MIPRTIHRIWLGPSPIPDDFLLYGQRWHELNPTWGVTLWHEYNLPAVHIQNRALMADLELPPAQRADILRLELLLAFGGLYVDCDVEPIAPIPDVIADCEDPVITWEDEHFACNAVMAAPAQHPFIRRLVYAVRPSMVNHADEPITVQTGPEFLTRHVKATSMKMLWLGPEWFYPYHHTAKGKPWSPTENTVAVHHWAHSWG